MSRPLRLAVDKIASVTRNVPLHDTVVVGLDIPARAGTVIAARVLDEKHSYNKLEDPHGRMMTVHKGDVIVGVLGARKALRGYTGDVPDQVSRGDILHLLNLGGVIGQCTSAADEVGPPARLEVLGVVLRFDEMDSRVGQPASIFPGPVPLLDSVGPLPPVIFVAGTCMHAGKTAAACALVRALSRRGIKVGAAKVTGVALRRDTLEMHDHGAIQTISFADAGLASTCDGAPGETTRAARGCMQAAARGADVLIVELGDGLLGEYGVSDVLEAPDLKAATAAVVLAANDPVAAWGGYTLLARMGLPTTVVTGPATDNEAGSRSVIAHTGVPCVNARKDAARLADVVLEAIGMATRGRSVPAQPARGARA